MSLLDKLLGKFNVSSEEELTDEEQKTLKRYKAILSKGEVTVASIEEFCNQQIDILHSCCDGKTPLTPIQQASLHIYLNLKKAIVGPKAEREALEQHLTTIIQS